MARFTNELGEIEYFGLSGSSDVNSMSSDFLTGTGKDSERSAAQKYRKDRPQRFKRIVTLEKIYDDLSVEIPKAVYNGDSQFMLPVYFRNKVTGFLCEKIDATVVKKLIGPKKDSQIVDAYGIKFLAVTNSVYPIWVFKFNDQLWKVSPVDFNSKVFLLLIKVIETLSKIGSEQTD